MISNKGRPFGESDSQDWVYILSHRGVILLALAVFGPPSWQVLCENKALGRKHSGYPHRKATVPCMEREKLGF
jgi:hypothetical protein